MDTENLDTTMEASFSEDEDCLFQDKISHAPCRSRRTRTSKAKTISFLSAVNLSSDDLSDFEFPQKKLKNEIAEFLKNPFRKKWKLKKKDRRKNSSSMKRKKSERAGNIKPRYSIPFEQRRQRLLHHGIQFPFTQLKYLPFKQYFTYEQFVLGGFLNHIKNLKYENNLKKSLKDMQLDEDLDHENFQMRKYSYLDDDGPLSPISEPEQNLNEDEAEEEEVKVVENSTFVLDCQVPSKESWKIKKRLKKRVRLSDFVHV